MGNFRQEQTPIPKADLLKELQDIRTALTAVVKYFKDTKSWTSLKKQFEETDENKFKEIMEKEKEVNARLFHDAKGDDKEECSHAVKIFKIFLDDYLKVLEEVKKRDGGGGYTDEMVFKKPFTYEEFFDLLYIPI